MKAQEQRVRSSSRRSSVFWLLVQALSCSQFTGQLTEPPILWHVWLLDISQGCCR
ncbi:hypothetical protein LINPERHAP2_LOCUS34629 [Linum perenne]